MKKTSQYSIFIYMFLFISMSIIQYIEPIVEYYTYYYFLLISILLLSIIYIKNVLILIPIYLMIYLGISLMNISNWRGIISEETILLYIYSISALLIPILLYSKRKLIFTSKVKFYLFSERKYFFYVLIIHIIIVYLSLTLVYLKVGPIILEQSLRFNIPTSLGYIIKSSVAVIVFLPFFNTSPKKMFFLVFILIAPTLLIGSRGVALIGLLSFFIVLYQIGSIKIKLDKKKIYYALFLGASLIYIGFYLRRTGSGALSTVEELLTNYFYYDNYFIYLVLPLYLSLRETVGLTSIIIDRNLNNTINDFPLFYADLVTVLPGIQKAAGQTLGEIIGRLETGGLTPGLLGGIYIDYKYISILFFFIFGLIFTVLLNYSKKNILFIPIFITILTQFFHLFHRGFLKPEYITSIIIVMFYFILMKKIKYN